MLFALTAAGHSSRWGARQAHHPAAAPPCPCCSIQARMSSTLQAVIRPEILTGAGKVLALTLRHKVEWENGRNSSRRDSPTKPERGKSGGPSLARFAGWEACQVGVGVAVGMFRSSRMRKVMTPSVANVLGQFRTIAREANTEHAVGFPGDGKLATASTRQPSRAASVNKRNRRSAAMTSGSPSTFKGG